MTTTVNIHEAKTHLSRLLERVRAGQRVIVWLTDDEERLGPGTRKLRAPDGLGGLLEAQGLRPLPLTSEHARAVEQFPELAGHDPFNRILVAQARSEGLTFLTADRRLLSLGYDWIDDATK